MKFNTSVVSSKLPFDRRTIFVTVKAPSGKFRIAQIQGISSAAKTLTSQNTYGYMKSL